MSQIPTSTKWRLASDILSSKIDDEVIIMGLQTDKYYGLDSVASRIWELLEQPRSLDDLVVLLLEEYDIDEATCRQETLEFLQEMSQNKLIEEIPGAE